ncbi:MAG: sigma-70 family RNA polymerase sigma factor [Planctomyces sp.]|nr:sigma-70 family RNA polymerase sigma factor [Planctomyces sp.]
MLPSRHQPFVTTQWSVVLEAGRPDSPMASESFAALCNSYWLPLYGFARRRGYSAADAADMTQAFFAELMEKPVLQTADPARGRFRNFLLTVFQRFLASEYARANTAKAGGRHSFVSLDFDDGERRYSDFTATQQSPESVFERQWAMTLLERSLLLLETEYRERGKVDLYFACRSFLIGNPAADRYATIAQTCSMTEGAFRVAIHRLRQRFRELLRAEVSATLGPHENVDDELEYLRRVLRSDG